jgi:DNA polymerase III alpha subunit
VIPPYAELHCVSNFSFLRGASRPEELVDRARAQGYAALAITDECSLAGVVRAHLQAKSAGLPLLVGAEFGLHGLFGHPDAPVGPPLRARATAARCPPAPPRATRARRRPAWC